MNHIGGASEDVRVSAVPDEVDLAAPSPRLGWRAKLTPSPSRVPLAGRVLIRTSLQRAVLGVDLVSTLYVVVSPGGVASHGHGPYIALGLMACSVVAWMVIVRTGRRLLLYRLAAGLVATAILASLADAQHEAMGAFGIAAVVEASMLRGPWAAAVPVTWFAVATVAGLGAPMYAMAVVVAFDWLLGWGIAIYMMLRERTTNREQAVLAGARSDEARLGARSQVLNRSGDTADLIQRAGVLLALHGSHVGRQVGATKREHADEAHALGGLLGTEVARWVATVNRSPDLGDRTWADMAPDAAALLLTRSQVVAVRSQLRGVSSRGGTSVHLVDGAPHRTDRDRWVQVGRHRILVPAEPGLRRWVQSPVPTACVLVVVWMLHPLATGLADQPLVPAAFFLGGLWLARWAYRTVELDPSKVWRVVGSFCCYVGAFAIASAPGAAVFANPEVRMAPAEGASELTVLLLALSRPYLSRRVQGLLPLIIVGLMSLNALSLIGSSWRNVLAESLFVPCMWLIARGWGGHLERTDATLERDRAIALEQLIGDSANAGRSDITAMLRDSLRQLRDERVRCGPSIDDGLRIEIDRRIDLAERSLMELESSHQDRSR